MSTKTLARQKHCGLQLRKEILAEANSALKSVEADDPQLHAKTLELAATEIAFVDHPHFRRKNGQSLIEALCPDAVEPLPPARQVGPGIAFLPEMVRAPLLTPEQERYFFLKMNFLRFRAEKARRRLRVHQPNLQLIQEIESLLDDAVAIRNYIAKANIRLLVAAARKLCGSLDHLGELVSEGLIPLLRAIDLFDVGRGHRFSTYATWAVRNQMIRMLRKQRTRLEVAPSDDLGMWDQIPDERLPERGSSTPLKTQQLVAKLFLCLSEREQQVVRARFGLDGEPRGQSLADISLQMGLSKERIRQVALKALEKMRQEAESSGASFEDDVFSVS